MAAPLITAGLFQLGTKLIDHFFPDKAASEAAKLELARLEQSGELAALAAETDLMKGQMAINAAEAAQPRQFITWREGFGWVCVATVAFKYIGGPGLFMLAQVFSVPITLPDVPTADLWVPLLGMLGLGTMGTVQAIKGTK